MSGSAEEGDRENNGGALDVRNVRGHGEVPLQEHGEPAEVVGRIREIAERLDVHDLRERELTELSDAALGLLDVAKAQSRDRDIAARRAQVEDWEKQHVTTGAEMVTDALEAVKEGIDKVAVGREDVSGILDLLEVWLTTEAAFRATHGELKQAVAEPNFELVDSLNTTLASLDAERTQAHAAIDGALAELGLGIPAPEKRTTDDLEPREPESTEPAGGLEKPEPTPPAEQPAFTTVVPREDAPESTMEEPRPAEDPREDDQRDAPPDDQTRPEDVKPSVAPADEPTGSVADGVGSTQQVEEAIAGSIEQGRLGLAYHLSLAAPGTLPSPNAIKLAAYSHVIDEHTPVAVAGELSELAAALLQEAETVTSEGPPGWKGHALLTTCAALAPALVAPGGTVAQLLASFDHWLDDTPSLQALARTAAKVSTTGAHLPMDLLRGEDSLERWRDREAVLRNETESWLTNERQSQIRYQAATKVWRRMLDNWERRKGQSSLGRMFALLGKAADRVNVEGVTRISEYWKDNKEKEIDRIDRENRSWKRTNKIEGSARLALRMKVDQALDLSDRWLRLLNERPEKRQRFQTEQARRLRATVHSQIDAALKEMNVTPVRSLGGSRALLRRYAALFSSTSGELDRSRIDLSDMLHGDLLALPEVLFEETRRVPHSPVDLEILWKISQEDMPDFGRAAVERAKRGDFIGAEAAVDFAERTEKLDAKGADQSRTVIESQREHLHSKLREKINDTSNRLDAAYAAGALPLRAYEQQRDRLPGDDLSELNVLGPLFAVLEEVDQDIADAESGRRDALLRWLGRLETVSEDDRGRIQSAIDSRHFQVADDYLERVEGDQPLPPPVPRGRPFDAFFPDFVQQYSDFCDGEGDGIPRARDVVARRTSEGFIDAGGLSEDASRDGLELLNAWVTLRDGATSPDGLRTLMGALGFTHPKVRRTDERTLGDESVFLVDTVPIVDRDIVQLPDFGSRANGRYRLFAVRRRTTGEAIVSEVERQPGAAKTANIALFFGILDVDERRNLARDFHTGGYHPTIVLDESLAVFLAAWPRHRPAAFFDCVSAFAFSQPFEPDAAELPPEMFFGREDARRAIVAKFDEPAHFVYGGRRLGKTTLLADIARESRTRGSQAPEELVLLLNLKGSGIGEDRPTDDLWRFFADKLAEHGVVGSRTRRAESIGKDVKQWLEQKHDRRVLLLVDEADKFLEAECGPSQNYRVLQQVKTLMEETERGFKVVFAGLHNVQRAARDPNTPLAHLGEAIRVGPMLPDDDGEGIENLIRGPLEALGYRFASNDLVIRVAAETNYYPALAQQFCKELLKTLREETHAPEEDGPPYQIHPHLVDRVFNAKETRDRIRNLFSWTIQLDPRYEFLTYLIARSSFDSENARLRAMPISDIRDEALREWSKGFTSDSSFWTFEVLLEEMVGLGILRETGDKQYSVRTRNLRMLLGNDDEIKRRFVDAKDKRAPAVFDRAQFRSPLQNGRRSSFTAHQEARLLSGRYGVGLVFGTRLAGLDRVGDSLVEAAGRRDESLFVREVLRGGFSRPARRRALAKRKAGVHIVLVDMRGAWNREVLVRTLEFVEEHEWEARIIRPILWCDPAGAWSWLSDGNEGVPRNEEVELHDIWLGPCGLDYTRIWLKDQEARAHRALERLDRPVDLPWPLVVETAAADKQLASIDEAIGVTLDEDEANLHVRDVVGISEDIDTALRVLSTFSGDSITADFLSECCEDEGTAMSPETVVDFCGWAGRLGVVYRDEKGYRLDATYAQGLKRVFDG